MTSPRLLLPVVLALAPACASQKIRTPEALRDAYAGALRRDDPEAAYRLLAPEVQARISRDEFVRRWRESPGEREVALADLEAVGDDQKAALLGATTVHEGGAVLRWAEVAGAYAIVGGLPGLPDTSTPAQAIRAFIAAVRSADLDRLAGLLSEELRARMADDWQERVDLIEARLGEPGAVELSADGSAALLRYAPGRWLSLEPSASGWRITALK